MLYFGALLPMVLCFASYMLITWLLQEVILSLLHFWSGVFILSLKWKFRFSLLFSWYWGCLLLSWLSSLSAELHCWSSWGCPLSDPATLISYYVFAPMEFHLKLRRDDGTLLPQPTRYWKLVGSIIYLLLLDQIFLKLFMSSVSLLVLPHQFIMRHYFVCFVISEAASLDHCYTVLIRLFLYELILMLDGPMIRTHATPPHAFVFFWVPLSFLGIANVKMLCLGATPRPNIMLRLIQL